MRIEIDTSTLLTHWRTSLNGLLEAAIAVVIAEMTLPPGTRRLVQVLAALRALVGFVQKDAGQTLAVKPGEKEPSMQPSHENPDDPEAEPVVQQ